LAFLTVGVELMNGAMDTARLGEGVKQGGAKGYAQDALRLAGLALIFLGLGLAGKGARLKPNKPQAASKPAAPQSASKPAPTGIPVESPVAVSPVTPYGIGKTQQVMGRGSTANLSKGTTLPRNLREQLAVEQAMANPLAGRELGLRMTDPRWPKSDGWVKMQQIVDSGGREGPINVHYLFNKMTGAIDDFKIVLPGRR
jgi:hypothetical protein